MATFFVIPPRECLEQAVVEFVARYLPGLTAPPAVTEALLSALEWEANRVEDVYFVHREDLPGFRDPVEDLMEGYGASTGDRVIEISFAHGSHSAIVRQSSVASRVSDSSTSR